MTLLDDLMRAETESTRTQPCPLCVLIRDSDEEVAVALTAAAAGTMGVKKLEAVMQANETGIGRRTITRHRREEHTP